MHGKWDWLKDELRGWRLLKASPILLRYLSGKVRGPDDLMKCALCPNMCRHACPVSIVDGKETTSPAGKARIALFIREGFLELSEENIEPLYICLSCNACSVWCPFGFSVADLIRPMKEEAMIKGVIPKSIVSVLENLKKYEDVYGEKPKNVPKKEKGEVLYLMGCTIMHYYPRTAERTTAIIEALGYDPFTIDEGCCGLPAYGVGDMILFKELARKQAERINSSNASLVVTSCPSCAYTYRVVYERYGIKINPRVLHISEFILENIDRLPMLKLEDKLVVHDPCRLAIGLERPDIIKNILSKVQGLEVLVPRRHGKETFCCGSGGMLSVVDGDLSRRIGEDRLKELMEDCERIVTACPTCRKTFEDLGAEVLDIVDVIYAAMGDRS